MSLLLLKSWFQDEPRNSMQSSFGLSTATNTTQNDLNRVERRLIELHEELQTLLDAQAERLVEVSVQDADSTRLSRGSRKAVPVRQPERRRISLRAARRGIKDAMRELSATTAQHKDLLSVSASDCNTSLEQLYEWEQKQHALHEEIETLEKSPEGLRLDALKQEDQSLQAEINAVELHLSELKSKQRAVRLETSTLQNSMLSKLSSYRESLKTIDAQITTLAKSSMDNAGISAIGRSTAANRSVTIEGARAHLQQSLASLEERRAEAETECEVLDEGITIWDEVMTEVQNLENYVAQNVKEARTVATGNRRVEAGSTEHRFEQGNLADRIRGAIEVLEHYLEQARSQGWNLLVCCIGAELEALSHAHDFLARAERLAAPRTPSEANSADKSSDISSVIETHGHDSTVQQPLQQRNSISYRHTGPLSDDDPSPDFLISKPEDDD